MDDFLFERRQSVQEIDPIMLDIILATSFEWRDLANRLASAGRVLPCKASGMLKLPQITYRMAHTACKIDNEFTRSLAVTLDSFHGQILKKVSAMELDGICACIQEVPLKNRARVAGLLWALATSEKSSVRKLARVFLQRIMTEIFASFYAPAEGDGFEEMIKQLLPKTKRLDDKTKSE